MHAPCSTPVKTNTTRKHVIGWGALTRVMRQPVPDGFDDIPAFNRAFETAIRGHPNLMEQWDPTRRAIRGGAIVTDLLKSEDPAIRAFKTALDAAVATYTRDLAPHIAETPDHPHLSAAVEGLRQLEELALGNERRHGRRVEE